ncbi:MAG: Uma2 family endonuclease [Rubrivivax sp.]
MALPAHKPTIEDFLAWEEAQPERHEFYRGEFFAMVGGRRVNGLVTGNLYAALRSRLAGTPCRAFFESMQLQVADDAIFYPDLFVTCDPADLKTERIFRAPLLVAEVLSESTQAYDRGLKFAAYRQLPSLREYLLVDPDTRRVEVFRRNERELFELHDQTGRTELHLASVDFRLTMAELFDGLDDEAASAAAP